MYRLEVKKEKKFIEKIKDKLGFFYYPFYLLVYIPINILIMFTVMLIYLIIMETVFKLKGVIAQRFAMAFYIVLLLLIDWLLLERRKKVYLYEVD